jgi:hypothetical protein
MGQGFQPQYLRMRTGKQSRRTLHFTKQAYTVKRISWL